MRAIARALVVAGLAAAPACVGAQRGKPTLHVDLGAGPSGDGRFANTGGMLARGGASLPLEPDLEIALDLSAFARWASPGCLLIAGHECPPSYPLVTSVVGLFATPVNSSADHRITIFAGPGAFHFHDSSPGPTFTSFGIEGGAEVVIARTSHGSLTFGARGDIVPNTPTGHLWVVPLTVGFRF